VETQDKKIDATEKKLTKNMAQVEHRLSRAESKFPLFTLVGILIIGGIVCAICAWKLPPLVAPVALGSAGLCVVILLKTYLMEILIVTGLLVAALLAWQLVRYFGFFRDLATDKTGDEPGLKPATEKAIEQTKSAVIKAPSPRGA